MATGLKYLDTLLTPAVDGYLRGLLPQPHPAMAAMEAPAGQENFPIGGRAAGRA